MGWGSGFDPCRLEVAEPDRALARLAWKNTVPGRAAPTVVRTRTPSPPPLRLVYDIDEAPPATITLRCTGKLLKLLRAKPHELLDVPPSPGNWYANRGAPWHRGRCHQEGLSWLPLSPLTSTTAIPASGIPKRRTASWSLCSSVSRRFAIRTSSERRLDCSANQTSCSAAYSKRGVGWDAAGHGSALSR